MKDIRNTATWVQLFKSDRHYGTMRFKWLGFQIPPFEIDEKLFDNVKKDDFNKIEINRIPLLLGSQFGLSPNIDLIPEFFNGNKLVAILSKSLLSGRVAGLSICQIEAEDQRFLNKRLVFYANRMSIN
ncbi:MAG: hypothetical protein ACK41Z_04295 [Sediminibacterium sp.]